MEHARPSSPADRLAGTERVPVAGEGSGGAGAPARFDALAAGRRGAARDLAGFADGERAHLRATPGFYARSWRRFRQDGVAMTALAVLALIALFVVAAPLVSRLTGFDPFENHLAAKLTPPGTDGYLLGADGNGRDILTRLAYGGRVTLTIAVLSAFATLIIGGAAGLAAGYGGGFLDVVLMRLIDVLLSIPSLPLLILVVTLYQPGPTGLALVLASISWMGIARVVRGEVLRLRHVEYVEAARLIGAEPWRVAARHVLPNVASLMIVFASLAIPELVLAEAALSFLGLGVQVPIPSWGNMINEAQRFFRTNPSNLLIPGLTIYVTSLALFLVGSGIRDAFDPRLSD